MNVPANTATQLPAHLLNFGSAGNLGLNAVSGINGGKSPPRISIKQNRFRTVDEQGQEFVIPQLYCDVIIVGANPVLSKTYYAGAYDPAAEAATAPTCWSDNGTAPSSRAQSPQSPLCATCQFNVWGSKVTPAGAKIKACADTKKLAVILADNPSGPVYQLRVPGASLENIKGIVDMLNQRGVPLPGLVIRMTFDETAGYPKLVFNALNYITEDQKGAVLEVLDGEEVKEAIGAGDLPIHTAGIAAPVASPAAIAPPPPPIQQFVAPLPPPPVQMPAPPQFMQSPSVSASVMQPPAAPVRRRRTKAEMGGANPTQMPPTGQQFIQSSPTVMGPVPAAPPPMPQVSASGFEIPPFLKRQDIAHAVPAAAAVPMQPQQTDAALDAILNAAMQK